MKENPSLTLLLHFEQDKPKPHRSRTLFWHFQQYKTPAVLYFSIFDRIKPQQYLIPAFSVKENPSLTLFLYFEQQSRILA